MHTDAESTSLKGTPKHAKEQTGLLINSGGAAPEDQNRLSNKLLKPHLRVPPRTFA